MMFGVSLVYSSKTANQFHHSRQMGMHREAEMIEQQMKSRQSGQAAPAAQPAAGNFYHLSPLLSQSHPFIPP